MCFNIGTVFYEATILGIVQGITEFLPISSSGHLLLVPKFFGFEDPGLLIDAFLHLGTLFAALVYFREDIFKMLKQDHKLAFAICLATVPAGFVGVFYKDFFVSNEIVRSTSFVAMTLAGVAVLMYLVDKFAKKEKSITDLSILGIFFVGCMQALALFPGTSRSGITLVATLLLGLRRDEAARFSFLVGLPAIAGAGLLSTKDIIEQSSVISFPWVALIWGTALSLVVGYWAIDFLIKFLKTNSLLPFVVYRIVLAILLIV